MEVFKEQGNDTERY